MLVIRQSEVFPTKELVEVWLEKTGDSVRLMARQSGVSQIIAMLGQRSGLRLMKFYDIDLPATSTGYIEHCVA